MIKKISNCIVYFSPAFFLFLMPHHIVGLALLDLSLQGLNLELSLLQLADALAGRTLVLVELTLLLFHKVLQKVNRNLTVLSSNNKTFNGSAKRVVF